jgi:hypothetical protein
MSIKAECTWGDGPDVLLNLNGKLFDLTADAAEKLAHDLMIAANNARELDSIAECSDENRLE